MRRIALRAGCLLWLAQAGCEHTSEIGSLGSVAPTDAGAAADAGVEAAPFSRVTFEDEFEGDAGALPSAERWRLEIGGGGWSEGQLQYNTANPVNVSLDGQGRLRITAREESSGGYEYTAARLSTQGLFAQAYGRFEARIALPEGGQGLIAQWWLLGDDYPDAGWPACGDITILEALGGDPAMYGSAYGPSFEPDDSSVGGSLTLGSGQAWPTGDHLYAVEWEPSEIRWYVDSTMFATATPADLPDGGVWVFDHPMFLVLYLAVGGTLVGPPDETSVFPQTMSVDSVRVYAW